MGYKGNQNDINLGLLVDESGKGGWNSLRSASSYHGLFKHRLDSFVRDSRQKKVRALCVRRILSKLEKARSLANGWDRQALGHCSQMLPWYHCVAWAPTVGFRESLPRQKAFTIFVIGEFITAGALCRDQLAHMMKWFRFSFRIEVDIIIVMPTKGDECRWSVEDDHRGTTDLGLSVPARSMIDARADKSHHLFRRPKIELGLAGGRKNELEAVPCSMLSSARMLLSLGPCSNSLTMRFISPVNPVTKHAIHYSSCTRGWLFISYWTIRAPVIGTEAKLVEKYGPQYLER